MKTTLLGLALSLAPMTVYAAKLDVNLDSSLVSAVFAHKQKQIELLLHKGANPNVRTVEGTPILIAALHGDGDRFAP